MLTAEQLERVVSGTAHPRPAVSCVDYERGTGSSEAGLGEIEGAFAGLAPYLPAYTSSRLGAVRASRCRLGSVA